MNGGKVCIISTLSKLKRVKKVASIWGRGGQEYAGMYMF
jgi:hypothetical protein